MTALSRVSGAALAACLCAAVVAAQDRRAAAAEDRGFLQWTRSHAESLGRSMRADGRVGGIFDLRVVHTEHSYNYKLRATWITPEVIKATARLTQLSSGLTDEETFALAREAEIPDSTVVLVEIDPREGSGVIPLDWVALMRPKQPGIEGGVRGTSAPELRKNRALAGVFKRDYAYEQFWLVFQTSADRGGSADRGAGFLAAGVEEAELVVRIREKEGRVSWRVPQSVRRLIHDR